MSELTKQVAEIVLAETFLTEDGEIGGGHIAAEKILAIPIIAEALASYAVRLAEKIEGKVTPH